MHVCAFECPVVACVWGEGGWNHVTASFWRLVLSWSLRKSSGGSVIIKHLAHGPVVVGSSPMRCRLFFFTKPYSFLFMCVCVCVIHLILGFNNILLTLCFILIFCCFLSFADFCTNVLRFSCIDVYLITKGNQYRICSAFWNDYSKNLLISIKKRSTHH